MSSHALNPSFTRLRRGDFAADGQNFVIFSFCILRSCASVFFVVKAVTLTLKCWWQLLNIQGGPKVGIQVYCILLYTCVWPTLSYVSADVEKSDLTKHRETTQFKVCQYERIPTHLKTVCFAHTALLHALWYPVVFSVRCEILFK